jgi:hypothetical protein
MNPLSSLVTHVAMLFFVLITLCSVSGAGEGALVPAATPWTDAGSLEDGTRDNAERAPKGEYGWKTAPPDIPDWKGLGRDTGYFLTYQALVVGLLYLAPESVSGWSKEQKDEFTFDEWRDNASNPHRDEDEFYVNYLLHPYWGGTYYIRGRERGLDRAQSFWFSALLSTLYEFGLEAFFEQPSYQDLWVTPVAGSLIGEYLFTPIRDRIRAKPGDPDWKDKVILFLTDPLGVIGAEPDRVLGLQTGLRFHAFHPGRNARSPADASSALYLPVDHALRNAKHAWGLQLNIRW